ncbi:MAG: hypothetical protein U9Q40_03815 [Campylobacterota bacterium]|nr:hypothetical protein [Campylobacterota bacterium]
MRFTLIKDLKEDSMMRPILSGLLIFILIYLLSDILVKHSSFGISLESVETTLFGNEDEFIDPISTASFLEFWHMEIFFIMMTLLTLSAVYLRLAKSNRYKILTLNLVMISSLLALISLLLSFFISPAFIVVYIVSFYIWHIGAIYMTLYSILKLYYD